MDKRTVLPRADRRKRRSTEMRSHTVAATVCGCALVIGCASGGGTKQATIPADGPSMSEVYRQHMGGSGGGAPDARPRQPQLRIELPGGADDVRARFVRLPNPDLVMFVLPHLSATGRHPIPGYSTVFPMYETVEYARPGELPWTAYAEGGR